MQNADVSIYALYTVWHRKKKQVRGNQRPYLKSVRHIYEFIFDLICLIYVLYICLIYVSLCKKTFWINKKSFFEDLALNVDTSKNQNLELVAGCLWFPLLFGHSRCSFMHLWRNSTSRCCKKQYHWLIFNTIKIVLWFEKVWRWHLCHHWSEATLICVPLLCASHVVESLPTWRILKSAASSNSSKFWVLYVTMFRPTSSKLFDWFTRFSYTDCPR